MRIWFGLLGAFLSSALSAQTDVAALLSAAAEAEVNWDVQQALRLYLQAEAAQPNDAFILQKISQQYSDATVDLTNPQLARRSLESALEYSQRAVALKPESAVNVVSVAVCYGKLALHSDTRTKVAYSKLMKEYAERALTLDPHYDWAHHLMGRWHCEVASLGTTKRLVVRLIYGGLPNASFEKAIEHLTRATELAPNTLLHRVELGLAHTAAGHSAEARRHLGSGLAMPSREKHDDSAKRRAREALAHLN